MSDVFGPLISSEDVTMALDAHIRLWQRAYLDRAGRGSGVSRRLPKIRKFRHTNERPDSWLEDDPPTLVIVTEDVEIADINGDGDIALQFPVGLALIVDAGTHEQARKLAATMGAALALLLNQKDTIKDGDGATVGTITEWIPYTFDDFTEGDRSLSTIAQGCVVQVPRAMCRFGGPATPTPDDDDPVPPREWPVADRVEINLIKRDPKEDL